MSKEIGPPLNYAIWVTCNNYTWFRIRLKYMSPSAIVYTNACQNSSGLDIARNYSFKQIFKDWKITLDNTEEQIRW